MHQTSIVSRCERIDLIDQRTAWSVQTESIGNVTVDRLQTGTQPGPDQFALAHRGIDNSGDHLDRDGETDPVRSSRARENHGVHTDQLAIHIDQRAAGIARIDRRVGLDEGGKISLADIGASQRRHNAGGHGLADTEGVADRQDKITDLDIAAHVKGQDRQGFIGLNPQDCQIGGLVGQQDLGRELAAVGQDHPQLGGAGDHMVIGHDYAGRVNDHP